MSAAGIHRHEHQQFLLDGMTIVLEDRVALPMPRAIRIHLPARRWSRRPECAEVVIPNVDGAAGRIAQRIVRPRSEAMTLAVATPREASTRFRNERAEAWVGHDIHPRRWGLSSRTEVN